MTSLEDADGYLIKIENVVRELKDKYDSKTSERVLSSHIWMGDFLEQCKKKVQNFKDSISLLKNSHVGEFKSATQFDTLLTLSNETIKCFNDLLVIYKMRASFIDIKMKLCYSLPQLQDKVKSMRNRFNIIKGQLSKKQFEYEEDSWF